VLIETVVDMPPVTDCVAETDALPDSVIVASLELLWLTVRLLLPVTPVLALADELAVPDCVEDTDVLLETVLDMLALPDCVPETDLLLEIVVEMLGLTDSVVVASLEMLWLRVTLLLAVAAVLPLPDELAVPDSVVLVEASLDTLADVESEEVADAVGWRVAVKLDV
jgi:hypothetical protein